MKRRRPSTFVPYVVLFTCTALVLLMYRMRHASLARTGLRTSVPPSESWEPHIALPVSAQDQLAIPIVRSAPTQDKSALPTPLSKSFQPAPRAESNSIPVLYSSFFETVLVPEPRMLSGRHLEFWRTKRKTEWGGVTGEMWRAFNFSLPVPASDCGMRATRGDFILREGQPCDPTPGYERVVVALPPEAWSWQHFMQDVMPKVWFTLQAVGGAHNLASRPFVLPPARDPIIVEILDYLRLSYVKEPTFPVRSVCVSDGLVTCKVPGAHPRLWRGIHSLLSLPPVRPPDRAVLVSRRHSRNGRPDANFDELQRALENMRVPITVYEGGSLREVQSAFSRAYMVIGSHGGGLMNIFFAPASACVIEHQEHGVLMGTTVRSDNAEMFYVIATGIGQTYWRLVAEPSLGFAFDIAQVTQAVGECHRVRTA